MLVLPVQLTTSRIGKPYPVNTYSAICDDYTWIHTLDDGYSYVLIIIYLVFYIITSYGVKASTSNQKIRVFRPLGFVPKESLSTI